MTSVKFRRPSRTASPACIRDALSVVGLVGVVFYRDWQLAIIAVLILPFAFLPIVKFGHKLRAISTKSLEAMGDITVILHETIGGNRIVKAFGMEEYEKRRFARENMRSFDYAMRSAFVNALSPPLMEFFGGIGIVAIIWYGGYSVIRRGIDSRKFLLLSCRPDPSLRTGQAPERHEHDPAAGHCRGLPGLRNSGTPPSEIVDKPGAGEAPAHFTRHRVPARSLSLRR